MQIQLIRSATLIVEMAGTRLLIDPWLAKKGAGRSYSGRAQSPLVDLPLAAEEILHGIDAVLVSHLHSDHFDDVAQRIIPKHMPILCHARDRQTIQDLGFQDVRAIGDGVTVGSVAIATTEGQHGPAEVLDDMGEVSGFLLSAPGEPLLYWAGDTILCPPVSAILKTACPDVVVVHGCGAVWGGKGPLVMDAEMVLDTLDQSGQAKLVVTHMDTVDHATVSRADIRAVMQAQATNANRLIVPNDGDILAF